MRSYRWLRFALPLAVVAGLAATTGIAHVVQQPDPTDASFLSPTSDAGDGARQLADGLTGDGVRLTVRRHSAEAIADAQGGGAVTIFVTTPELVHPTYLDQLATLPATARVVLVAPRSEELAAAGLDVDVLGPRWTAAAPQPGCSADYASAAGPAAVQRWRYGAASFPAVRCYEDGLIELRTGGTEVTLVGAADPFRNDRADEHGNQVLARGLLARDPVLIWLDLHEREPAPPDPTTPPTEPGQTGTDGDSDDEGDGSGDTRDPGGEDSEPGDEGEEQEGSQADGEQARGGSNAVTQSPLARAFPPAVWATLALLVLAALALAAASARRLGAPVAEPLPVRVRAAETVRGLGGLYRRAGARSTSLATLQSAARLRLAEHYGLPADVPADEIAERVAATIGQPVAEVRHMLSGGVEDSDEELARAATTLQNLVRFVTGQHWQRGPDEGNVT